MALKGTLGDFSLTDILQLIGLQRKTGSLMLRRGNDEISVSFDLGRVVAADSTARPVEDRVGSLLVRTGKLTEARLDRALKIQKETLQRLGHVLAQQGWVEEEAIRRQLSLQITETLFELFRWHDGEYDFQPSSSVEWDQEFITPINCEHLIMEGAQMVDEWPLIERVIPSRTVVLKPTEAAAEVLATAASDTSEVKGSVYEDDIDFGFITDPLKGDEGENAPKLSQREIHVLRWVDGGRTAIEIADLTELGAFEAFKTLARLVEARLVEPTAQDEEERRSSVPRLFLSATPAWILVSFLALFVLVGALSAVQEVVIAVAPGAIRLPLPRPVASAEWFSSAGGLDQARYAASGARLARIAQAIKVFSLAEGRWPRRLDELSRGDYVEEWMLNDPWGRAYIYDLQVWGFRLEEAAGSRRLPVQFRERRFTALERVISAAE